MTPLLAEREAVLTSRPGPAVRRADLTLTDHVAAFVHGYGSPVTVSVVVEEFPLVHAATVRQAVRRAVAYGLIAQQPVKLP